jgi:hypothetical protein
MLGGKGSVDAGSMTFWPMRLASSLEKGQIYFQLTNLSPFSALFAAEQWSVIGVVARGGRYPPVMVSNSQRMPCGVPIL